MSDRHDRHESLCEFDVFKFLLFLFFFSSLNAEDRTDDSKDKESKIQVVGYDIGDTGSYLVGRLLIFSENVAVRMSRRRYGRWWWCVSAQGAWVNSTYTQRPRQTKICNFPTKELKTSDCCVDSAFPANNFLFFILRRTNEDGNLSRTHFRDALWRWWWWCWCWCWCWLTTEFSLPKFQTKLKKKEPKPINRGATSRWRRNEMSNVKNGPIIPKRTNNNKSKTNRNRSRCPFVCVGRISSERTVIVVVWKWFSFLFFCAV